MLRYPDPFLRNIPLRRLMDRMLDDMASQQAYQDAEQGSSTPQAQSVPVNIFQTPEQIVIVAPMPGVSPDDIEVNVTHDTVHLKASYRGPHQEEQDYLVREWSYGPYERTIRLAAGVDAERTNASFNNGVLVLNLPKRDVTRSHRVRLQTEHSARGLQEVRSGTESLQQGGNGSQANRAAGAGNGESAAAGKDIAAVGSAGIRQSPSGGEISAGRKGTEVGSTSSGADESAKTETTGSGAGGASNRTRKKAGA